MTSLRPQSDSKSAILIARAIWGMNTQRLRVTRGAVNRLQYDSFIPCPYMLLKRCLLRLHSVHMYNSIHSQHCQLGRVQYKLPHLKHDSLIFPSTLNKPDKTLFSLPQNVVHATSGDNPPQNTVAILAIDLYTLFTKCHIWVMPHQDQRQSTVQHK